MFYRIMNVMRKEWTLRCRQTILGLGMLSLALFFSACSSDNPQEEPEKEPEVEQPDPPAPSPEPDEDNMEWENAEAVIQGMGIGWNLGNTLDAHDFNDPHDGGDWKYWETYWGQSETTPELMYMLKKAGYGTIRVPVTWGIHMDANGQVNSNWMNRVKQVVEYVLNAGMYCILNVHHDTGADEKAWLVASMKEYKAQKARYEGLWKQIAETFQGYGPRLLFESYNEMLDERRSWCFATFNGGYDATVAADAYEAINCYAQSFVDVVRATGGNNAKRNLIVNTYGACNGVGTWNEHLIDPLVMMKLPKDIVENHLLFEIHTYPNIDNLSAAKAEVAGMITNLKKHLVDKGAPVIIGEWGNSSDNPSLTNKVAFISDFVRQVKAAGMGMCYWMGITDGIARQVPAFSEPECARAMLQAYHGNTFEPELPSMDAMNFNYVVTYKQQWSEVHLCSENISLNDYIGVKVELDGAPANGALSVKIYGETEGTEQYVSVAGNSQEVTFDKSRLGNKVRRVTLQCSLASEYSVTIKRAALIRKDGTEEIQTPTTFWGCDVVLRK